MSVLAAYARARAVREGRAQPIATVRHLHLSPRPMVFIRCARRQASHSRDARHRPGRATPAVVRSPRPRPAVCVRRRARRDHAAVHRSTGTSRRSRRGQRRSRDALQPVPNRGDRVTRPRNLPVPPRRRTVHPSAGARPVAHRRRPTSGCRTGGDDRALAAHWATGQSRVEDGNLPRSSGGSPRGRHDRPGGRPPPRTCGPRPPARTPRPSSTPRCARDPPTRRPARPPRCATHSQLEPTWQVMCGVSCCAACPKARACPPDGSGTAPSSPGAIRIAGRPAAGAARQRGRRRGAAVRDGAAQQAFGAAGPRRPDGMVEHRLEGRAHRRGGRRRARPQIVPPGRTRAMNRPLVTVAAADGVAPGDARLRPPAPALRWSVRHGAVVAGHDGMGRGARPAPGVPGSGAAATPTRPGNPTSVPEPEETPGRTAAARQYVPTDEDAMEDWS